VINTIMFNPWKFVFQFMLPLALIVVGLLFVQWAELRGVRDGQAMLCPDLLHEQHTLFDSIGVADAWPVCWDYVPVTDVPLRYRQAP
jgi:hypothetical protein